MSTKHLQNVYHKAPPQAPDLSSLPDHLREALDRPVPIRTGEVTGRIRLWERANTTLAGVRVFAAFKESTLDGADVEMVSLRVNDVYGRAPIAQIDIEPSLLTPLLCRLIRLYKQRGGQLRPLLDAYKEINE